MVTARVASSRRETMHVGLATGFAHQRGDVWYALSVGVNFRKVADQMQVSGGCSVGEDGSKLLGCGIDCDGKIGLVRLAILAGHPLKPKCIGAFFGDWDADETPTVGRHEVDGVRCYMV